MKIQKASKAGTAMKSKAPEVGIAKPKSKQQQTGQILKMVKKIKPNDVQVSGLKAKGANPKSPVEGRVKKIKRATVKSNGQKPSVEGLAKKISRAIVESDGPELSAEGFMRKMKRAIRKCNGTELSVEEFMKKNSKIQAKTKKNEEKKEDAVKVAMKAAAQLMFPNIPPEELPEHFLPGVPLAPKVLVPKERLKAALEKYREHVTNNAQLQKQMFDPDLRYGFQIVSIKKMIGPKIHHRIPLPHSLLDKDSEICLIVKDVDDVVQGTKCDYEKTLLHWQDKLRELGVDFITEIIPFQQLKMDFSFFEMQRKLHRRFDRFLVDSRVGDHAMSFLGSWFYQTGKYPTQVSVERDKKVKRKLENALRKVTFACSETSAVIQIPFTTHTMPVEQAIENGMALLESLKTIHPGGWGNIHAVYLKPMAVNGTALPVYISFGDPNLVPVPGADDARLRKERKCNDELKAIGSAYEVRYNKVVRSKTQKRAERAFAARETKREKSREAKAQNTKNKKNKKRQTADPGK